MTISVWINPQNEIILVISRSDHAVQVARLESALENEIGGPIFVHADVGVFIFWFELGIKLFEEWFEMIVISWEKVFVFVFVVMGEGWVHFESVSRSWSLLFMGIRYLNRPLILEKYQKISGDEWFYRFAGCRNLRAWGQWSWVWVSIRLLDQPLSNAYRRYCLPPL